jgi:hypothetical protein
MQFTMMPRAVSGLLHARRGRPSGSAYTPRLSVIADVVAWPPSAMYGRRPRCKGKESDVSANRSGAAMYPAFECSRLAAGPDVIR